MGIRAGVLHGMSWSKILFGRQRRAPALLFPVHVFWTLSCLLTLG